MKRKTLITTLIISCLLLTACNTGMSAEELTDYYAEKAKEEAIEKAKEAADETVDSINRAIDENETASKIRDGATTAGEYAQDAYDYAKNPNTISSAKEQAQEVKEGSVNFFVYMIKKIEVLWEGVKEDFVKGSQSSGGEYRDVIEDLENASEYDFLGPYKNPIKESQGIDTSENGTAIEQLKDAYRQFTQETKDTIDAIKNNHDVKHAKTERENNSENVDSESLIGDETVIQSEISSNNTYSKKISETLLPLIPEYDGNPYCIVNNNTPFFDESELTTKVFEVYSLLDDLGRTGVAYACFGTESLPSKPREAIGMYKPSGWNQAKYDVLKDVDNNPAGYYQCRMHLLMYALGGNDHETNLCAGTFYCNLNMEKLEIQALSCVKNQHHVLYRTTPIYNDEELMCRGVLMEARSVEDESLSFCVFVYNAAPGIKIDYKTGKSSLVE